MAKHPTKERFWLHVLKDGDVRIRCSYKRRGKRIDRFTVQLEMEVGGAWRPVVRYDNAHGFCHRDTIHADGSQERTSLAKGSTNDTFTFAVDELKTNWEEHCARFMGELEK